MAAPLILPVEIDASSLPKQIGDAIQRAQSVASRPIRFNIDGQPLGRITGDVKEFEKSLAASNARVIAFGATTGILYGIGRAFASLVQSTIEVEKKLKDIQVLTGGTSASFQKLQESIFNTAKNTSSSFSDVADAAEELARQGLSIEQSMKRANDAMILARLSGEKTADAVRDLTAAYNTFKDEALDTSEIVNKLANVDANFAVSQRDLAQAISRAGASAQSAKVSFDEFLGAVTSLQQTTARGGSVIANGLKTIFTRIQTEPVIESLKSIGVEVESLPGKLLPGKAIIENLARAYQNLGDVQKNQIAKQVAGTQQINLLKALLADAAKNTSVWSEATKTAAGSTNEAILRNEELNKSLDALIKQTGTNLTALFSKIGSVTVAPAFKNLLQTFNGVLDNLQTQPKDSVGSKIGEGILKGIADSISGPGKIVLFAVFLKLFSQVTTFAAKSFSDLAGLNKQTEEQKEIQAQINQVIASGNSYYAKRLSAVTDIKKQEELILSIVKEQNLQVQQRNVQYSGVSSVLNEDRNILNQRKLRSTLVSQAAGGILPAMDKENAAIQNGVGGANSGDSPRVINGFKFGNGKVGTVVANTGEVVVDNFAGGNSSAIFNRDMVKAIGGMNNLSKFGKVKGIAADGLIPSYALGQIQSMFGDALVARTGSHANIEGIQTYVPGQGHSKFVYEDVLSALKEKGVKTVSGKLLPQFNDPRGKDPVSRVKAMFPQIIRAGMTTRSELRVNGNKSFKFTGANFEKELQKNAPAILEAMKGGLGNLVDTDLISYLAGGLIPALNKERAATGESPKVGFDSRLPGGVGVYSPSQGTLHNAINQHLSHETGRTTSNLGDTGKVPTFAPTLSPTDLFKIGQALQGLKDTVERLNVVEKDRVNRLKRDQIQEKALAGEALTPQEKRFLTVQGRKDQARALGISQDQIRYVSQTPAGRRFVEREINAPVRAGNQALYSRSEQQAIMKNIAEDFRKELSKGIFSGGLLGTGGIERRINERYGGRLGSQAQAFVSDSLVNLNQQRFQRRQSFGLNSALLLPLLAESGLRLSGVNAESRSGRTASGVIEAISSGGSVAALAPNRVGVILGATLAAAGTLRSITGNTGKSLEQFTREVEDASGKMDEQNTAIANTVNSYEELQDAIEKGAPDQVINRIVKIFQDSFNQISGDKRQQLQQAFVSGNIDTVRGIQTTSAVDASKTKKANDFFLRLADFNEQAGTSSNYLGQILAPSRQSLTTAFAGNDSGASLTQNLFKLVNGTGDISSSSLGNFLPRLSPANLKKITESVGSLPVDSSAVNLDEVKSLISKNYSPTVILKAIFEKSKLPTDVLEKIAPGINVNDANDILQTVIKKIADDSKNNKIKDKVVKLQQNTSQLIKITEDVFSDVGYQLELRTRNSQAIRERAATGAEAALELRKTSLSPEAFANTQQKISDFRANTDLYGNIATIINSNLKKIQIPEQQLNNPETSRGIAQVVDKIVRQPENIIGALKDLTTVLKGNGADKSTVEKVEKSVGNIGREVGQAIQTRDIALQGNQLQRDISQAQISRERALGFFGGDTLNLRNRDFNDITKGAYAFSQNSGLNSPIYSPQRSAFGNFFNPIRDTRAENARNADVLGDRASTILALDKEKLLPQSGEGRDKLAKVVQSAFEANLTYAFDQLDTSALPKDLKDIIDKNKANIPDIAKQQAENAFPSGENPNYLTDPLQKFEDASHEQYDAITKNIEVISGNTDGINKLQGEIKNLSDRIPVLVNSIDSLVKGAISGPATPSQANGYLPAYSKEVSAINNGVGGARRGDSPVLKNIAGLGPAVVNTGEKIIRNFMGSGRDAVFNRNMINAAGGMLYGMGSVENAAGGHVPNLAYGLTSNIDKYLDKLFSQDADFYDADAIAASKKEYKANYVLPDDYGFSDRKSGAVFINTARDLNKLERRDTIAHELFHTRNPFLGNFETLARFAGAYKAPKNASFLSRLGSGIGSAARYNYNLLTGGYDPAHYGTFFNRNSVRDLLFGGTTQEPIFGDKIKSSFNSYRGPKVVSTDLGYGASYYKEAGLYGKALISKVLGGANNLLLRGQGYTPVDFNREGSIENLIERFTPAGKRKANAYYFSPQAEGIARESGDFDVREAFKSRNRLVPEVNINKLDEARRSKFLPQSIRFSDALKTHGLTANDVAGRYYENEILKPISGLQSSGIIRPGESIPAGLNAKNYILQEAYKLQPQRSLSRSLFDFLDNKGGFKFRDYSNLFADEEYRTHVATDEFNRANTVRYSTSAKSSPFRSLFPNFYENSRIKAIETAGRRAVQGLGDLKAGQVFGVDVARIDPEFARSYNKEAGFEKFTSYRRSLLERLIRGNFAEKEGFFGALELNPTGKSGASGNAGRIFETQAFLAGVNGKTPIHALDQLIPKIFGGAANAIGAPFRKAIAASSTTGGKGYSNIEAGLRLLAGQAGDVASTILRSPSSAIGYAQRGLTGVSNALIGETLTGAGAKVLGGTSKVLGKVAVPLTLAIEGGQQYINSEQAFSQEGNRNLTGLQRGLVRAAGFAGTAADTLSALDPTGLFLGHNDDKYNSLKFKAFGGSGLISRAVKTLFSAATKGTSALGGGDASYFDPSGKGDAKYGDYLRDRALEAFGGESLDQSAGRQSASVRLSRSGEAAPDGNTLPYDLSRVNPAAIKFLNTFDKAAQSYAETGQYDANKTGGLTRGLSAIQAALGKGGGDPDTRAYYEQYLKDYASKVEGRNQTFELNRLLAANGAAQLQQAGLSQGGSHVSDAPDAPLSPGQVGVDREGKPIFARGYVPNFAKSTFSRATRQAIRSLGGVVDTSSMTVGPLTALEQMIQNGNLKEAREYILSNGLPARYSSAGYGPQDLGALAAAIGREKESLLARGISNNLADGYIFVGHRPEIGGYGVGNYLDEPNGKINPNLGILQGINRVRSEGGNPRGSGVPNYANTTDVSTSNDKLIEAIDGLVKTLEANNANKTTGGTNPEGSDIKVDHTINVNASISGEIQSNNDKVSEVIQAAIVELKARLLALEAANKDNKNFVPRPPGTANVNI